MTNMKIRVHEKKGDVDLNTMMSEFKQALGGSNFKMQAYSEPTKYGVQQLVIKVQGVGEFVCSYELAYNGGSFKIRTWDADASFDWHGDLDVFHKLEKIFNRYCEG